MEMWRRLKELYSYVKEKNNKTKTEALKLFCSNEHPQEVFVPLSLFDGKQKIEFEIDILKTIFHMELIFNGQMMMLIGRTSHGNTCKIVVYKSPVNSLSNELKFNFDVDLEAHAIKKVFVLHSGSSVVILSSRLVHDKLILDKYHLSQDSAHLIETLVLPGYRYSRSFSIVIASVVEHDYIAFALTDLSRHPQPWLIYVFSCTPNLLLQGFIDVRRIARGMVSSLCFLDDCSQLAIVTSCLEYILFDIETQGKQKTELASIVYEDNEENSNFEKIFVESSKKEILFVFTSSGVVFNTESRKQISVLKDEKGSAVNIFQTFSCQFSKLIFLISRTDELLVYDPFRNCLLVDHNFRFSSGPLLHVVKLYESCFSTFNWFGNEFFRALDRNVIEVFKISCRNVCTLKHLSRLCILQNFSKVEIKNLHLNKKLVSYIFQEI